MSDMKTGLAFVFLLFFYAPGPWPQKPHLPEADRIRLAEAFRIGEILGDRVWSGWDKAPFAVLLVTPENEFLVRHPRPTEDFTLIGFDPLLKSDVYFRKRTQPTQFLATFPAVGGISTIVIGQAENTAVKTSTPWVVTALHEHFHQLQDTQPNYYADVNALNLSGGDQTGMWQLNYPFPYSAPDVKRHFESLSRLLAETVLTENQNEFSSKLAAYVEARRKFENMISPADYRYLSFQLWKEGASRYTEYRIARLAAVDYKPSKEFQALKDYSPFNEVADKTMNTILRQLTTLKFDEYRREAFYPFGAGEALLLDRANPKWQSRYFVDKFYVDRYFTQATPLAAVDTRMVTDEAEAALAILEKKMANKLVTEADWQRLFSSEDYARLKQRETAMQRPFEDEEFKTFLLSNRMVERTQALKETLDKWKRADVTGAARLALAYLPEGARIRAKIYPVIKPVDNSFVFDVKNDPAIFLYLDPAVGKEKFENTLAHELHHIGYGGSCPSKQSSEAISKLPQNARTMLTWVGGFGEGVAMLAAAGGADVHPHAVSGAEERARWDRDLANFNDDLKKVEKFYLDILKDKLSLEEIQKAGFSFFGVQGPWYTVGWRMASLIEKTYGRQRLIECICDRRKLLSTYNEAAAEYNRGAREPLALWAAELINSVSDLR
ncbi:MAG TPA: DUF5700 domain-containing putative Zn-dependent protease [Blastocatellia bacterium]|nr:DUF5700 domain-containing putative Zn-dependent protease [Blastocatellia bacterium]